MSEWIEQVQDITSDILLPGRRCARWKVNGLMAPLARTEQLVRRGYSVYLIKFFIYLPKCKLKRVCSQPCNSNTAAPSVESGENDNVLYIWSH